MRATLAKRMYEAAAALVWFSWAARVCIYKCNQNKIREFGGQLPSEILKQAGRKPATSQSKPAQPDEFDRTIEEVRRRSCFRPLFVTCCVLVPQHQRHFYFLFALHRRSPRGLISWSPCEPPVHAVAPTLCR